MCKADPFVKNSGTEGKCQRATSPQRRLSQAAGLAFGLEQAEDVVLTDCAQLVLLLAGGRRRGELRTSALDVADDGTGLVVHELDTALGDTTTGACRDHCQPGNSLTLAMLFFQRVGCSKFRESSRTGSAKDTGDLDELDGSLCGIHYVRL